MGTPYLITTYGLEKAHAASLVSVIFLGWAFGAPFAGWLSDRIRKRRAILIIGSGLCSASVAVICLVPEMPLWLTVAMLLIAGASGAAMALCFALVRENSSDEISGSVTGIVNSLTVASGAILQPCVGLILDQLWDGQISEGVRVYSTSDFKTGFLLILASCAIGFLASLTLKESNFSKSEKT